MSLFDQLNAGIAPTLLTSPGGLMATEPRARATEEDYSSADDSPSAAARSWAHGGAHGAGAALSKTHSSSPDSGYMSMASDESGSD